MLAITACGSNSPAPADSGNTAAKPAEGNDNTKSGTEAANEAAKPAADNSAETPVEAGTKTVSTVHGDIEIPVKPQRIITDGYLGSLIALGVTPVGTPSLQLKNQYFAEALKGVADIGDSNSSSMERIIDLQPDLIITATKDEARYDLLAKAAPTVAIPYGELTNAHEELTYFGQLLGLEKEAAAWLADYEQQIADAKAKVDQAIPADASFTIFEEGGKAVWVYGDNFGRGGQPIYQALGRKPPAEVAEEIMDKQWKELSLESLAEYAGDYIVLTSNNKTAEDFKKDPVWNTLDAIKNDRFYVWKEERSWYYDPIAVLSQTNELADWLAGN
ncbi:ABC transporter substrate-binding protein [Paenibacillaceae bacterium]|nr:ABC transporter substrate-binding protein [Paenibacillaceae bacterium]